MFIAFARVRFTLSGPKEIAKLVSKVRGKFNCAAANVDDGAGFTLVSGSRTQAQAQLDTLMRFLEKEASIVEAWTDVVSVEEIAAMDEPTLADAEGIKRDWDEHASDRKKREFLERLRKHR